MVLKSGGWGKPTLGSVLVRGGNLIGGAQSEHPFVSASIAGEQGSDIMLNGHLTVEYSDVNRVRVWTDQNAVGRLKLFGLNL